MLTEYRPFKEAFRDEETMEIVPEAGFIFKL